VIYSQWFGTGFIEYLLIRIQVFAGFGSGCRLLLYLDPRSGIRKKAIPDPDPGGKKTPDPDPQHCWFDSIRIQIKIFYAKLKIIYNLKICMLKLALQT
jgi:hypothetical protein